MKNHTIIEIAGGLRHSGPRQRENHRCMTGATMTSAPGKSRGSGFKNTCRKSDSFSVLAVILIQTSMELVKAARRGREDAFLQLFDEHHLPLFRFAYRMTGSVADAEDIVQECFLELLRPECSYDPRRTSVRTYLFGVIRNQSLKRLRKNDLVGEGDQDAQHDRSPETEVLRSELEGVVARAVMRLPETQREVLILAHYEQIPLAEIARVLAVELGAVKSRLQRARARLKESLAAYAPGLERKG